MCLGVDSVDFVIGNEKRRSKKNGSRVRKLD